MNRAVLVAGLLALTVPTHASWRPDLSSGAVVRSRRPAAAVGRLAWAETDAPRTRDEIEAEQRRVEQHLLRVQQERFEARARGDSEQKLRRLDREFGRTQQRRIEVIRDLEAAPE